MQGLPAKVNVVILAFRLPSYCVNKCWSPELGQQNQKLFWSWNGQGLTYYMWELKGKDLKLSGEGRWHYYFMKWNTGIFQTCTFWGVLEVHLGRTEVKLVWRKKILEAKTFLVVFKTPRQMEKPGQGRSLNQVQHLKVINKQQPVQVTAFLFTLTRSLMKFYSISRVQTRSKFQLNRNTAIITGLDGCTWGYSEFQELSGLSAIQFSPFFNCLPCQDPLLLTNREWSVYKENILFLRCQRM